MHGTVRVWYADKGYGYIVGDDNFDYYVHRSEVWIHGKKDLEVGQRVTFDPAVDKIGHYAVYVVDMPLRNSH